MHTMTRLRSIMLAVILCFPLILCPTAVTSQGDHVMQTTSLVEDWSFPPLGLEQQGSELGIAVSSAGDVNGDGYGDIMVGAPKASLGTVDNEGLVYVFHGGPGGLSTLPDQVLASGVKGSYFGGSLAAAGDVNHDGYDDVIVGAYKVMPEKPLYDAGAVFVFYGSAQGLADTAGWSYYGDVASGYVGYAVSGAGDTNHDTFDDIIVGAPGYSQEGMVGGRAYLFYGSADGPVTTTVQILSANRSGAFFGGAVGGAGDANHDTYHDVVVGAPGYTHEDLLDAGAAFVYLGSTTGITTTGMWQVLGDQEEARLGTAVSGVGDLNKDGYGDIAVGSPWHDVADLNEGRVSVYYGGAAGPVSDSAWVYNGATSGQLLGTSVSAAGDVNADGYDDLIIGAPAYSVTSGGTGQDSPEIAIIFLGGIGGLDKFAAWRLEGRQADTGFGMAVAGAGRTNSDSYDDILVGAPQYKQDRNPVGRAFAYLGQAYAGPPRIYLPVVQQSAP